MKNKIFLMSALIAGIFLLNSCLKDDHDYWKDQVAGKMYATVAVPTLQTLGLAPVADEVPFSFMINIATDALPTEDITVTLKVDAAALTAYNTLKGKAYKLYPNIQILTPTVTVAKGTRTATVNCKVWGADALNACDNYVAPISIDNVSGGVPIASNMKSYLLALPISNPYAADYNVNGYRKHPAPAMYYVTNKVETCSTVNCSTIKKSFMADYPYDVTIEVTSDIIVVGGVNCFKCKLHVLDPSTGEIVSSGDGQFDTFTGDATATPKPIGPEVNYYNPATKKFVLNYYYNSAAPRIAYEIMDRL